jgi:Pilus assembly protein, PilO
VSLDAILKTTKGRLALGGAGLVVVLLAGWFLGVSPQKTKVTELKAMTDDASSELAQKKAALAHPSAEVTIKAKDGYLLGQALPDRVDIASTVLDVQRLAKRHHLGLITITPEPQVQGVGSLAAPVNVAVQGRFDQVSAFLGDLRSGVTVKRRQLRATGPVYSITKVEIGQPDEPDGFPVVKASVTFNTFSFDARSLLPAAGADGETSTPSPNATVAAGATP